MTNASIEMACPLSGPRQHKRAWLMDSANGV